MSDTNWKNLGRKQGANMKKNRNVKLDKAYFTNGNWDTVYTDDDIKRLAYFNIDLPHVVGIGTKTPFSKLSFGDSSIGDSGHHISGILTPGKVTAIALHEKSIDKALDGQLNASNYNGQDFTGLSYVEKIRSIRQNLSNEDAKGVAIYSNKSSANLDTSLKTNKAILYVTDDNLVQIGGLPSPYIFAQGNNASLIPSTNPQETTGNVSTGPNILLDISGSMHVNGFINFLKNGGTDNPGYENDNPAGQMKYQTNAGITYVDEADESKKTGRAVPNGAIWVGWEKGSDGNEALSGVPRLYLQRNGINSRVLTEYDDLQELIQQGSGGSSGTIDWDGDTDSNNNGSNSFYAFRQPNEQPGNTIINTYVGRDHPTSVNFTNSTIGNDLPRLFINSAQPSNDPTPSALSVVGNLSVFDFTKGGKNATELSGALGETLGDYKRVLYSDIYAGATTTSGDITQRELGSIYTDRHIMIGGFKTDSNGDFASSFRKFTSAIDISGGIHRKPGIRIITGDANQLDANVGNTLLVANNNCRDSIIIGNTDTANFDKVNTESIIVGTHSEIKGAQNSIIQGSGNSIRDISNSLVIGKSLSVGQSGTTMEGVVVLGEGPVTVGGDERIVFATNDGANAAVKALVVDKDGNVTTGKNLTITGDLNVKGDEVILEVKHKVVEDGSIKLAGKGGDGNTASSGTLSSADVGTTEQHEAGLKIFIHDEDNTTHFVQWTFDEEGNQYDTTDNDVNLHTHDPTVDGSGDRWTTAMSSRPIGIAAAADTTTVGSTNAVGRERFKVMNNGDLLISSDGTTANNKFKVTASSGNTEIDGTLVVKGETDVKANFAVQDGTTDKFTVASSTGNTVIKGSLTVNNSSGIILENDETITNSTDGTVLINGELAAGTGSAAGVFKSNGSKDVILKTGNGTTGSITINNGAGGNITLAPNGTGKIVMFGEHNPNTSGAHFEKNGNKVDLLISGKLTVDGLIDPTGLILDNATAPGNADVNGKLGLYFDGTGALKTKTFDGTDATERTLATTQQLSEITSGTGGTNVNSANNINVTGTTTGIKKILFATGTNGNQQVLYDSNSLSYNASTNTLTTDKFEGKATKLDLNSAGFVKVAANGSISVDTNTYNNYTLPIASTSVLGGIKVGTNLSINAAGVLSSTDTNTTYTGGTNITLNGTSFDLDDSITLPKGASRTIQIDQVDSGNGNNLTIKAGSGSGSNPQNPGGNLILSGGGSGTTEALNVKIGTGTNPITLGQGKKPVNNTGTYNLVFGSGTPGASIAAVSPRAPGNYNIAIGKDALKDNNTGNGNVAVGSGALQQTVGNGNNAPAGNSNVAIGSNAGYANTTGNRSIYIGDGADGQAGSNALSNAVVIGFNAKGSGSNQITLGNGSITSLRCQMTSITGLSDKRDKKNIVDIPYGLELINNLQPRQFTWDIRGVTEDNPHQGTTRVGFIAQEVQTVLGKDNNVLNMVYDVNPEKLELSYSQLVPVLTKAVQELSSELTAEKEKTALLESKLTTFEARLAALEA